MFGYRLVYFLTFFKAWTGLISDSIEHHYYFFANVVSLVGFALGLATFVWCFRALPWRRNKEEGTLAARVSHVLKGVAEKIWRLLTMGPVQFCFIALAIAVVQIAAYLAPAVRWMPNGEATDSLAKTLWQVHASIIGVTVVVVTIIITVIANERDRTRTWKLYAENTKFLHIIWFNLLAILSEGIASFQTSQATESAVLSHGVGNLVLAEGFLLTLSVLMAGVLFTVTMRFLDEDHVEKLAEKRIMRAMPKAVDRDMNHIRQVVARLKGPADGH